jgi:hypothetical protein
MGAWSVTLFGNDVSLDVRDDYRGFSHFIEDEKELKKLIFDRHRESMALDDERPLVYYTLAYCQWKNGRLDNDIKEEAIYYIDHPDEDGNLNLWKENALTEQDPKYKKACEQLYHNRIKVLQDLKAMLESPMPPKKKKKVRTGMPPSFEIGDIVRVSLTEKDYRRYVKEFGRHFSESALKKIEALFDDKHFYIVKVGEKKAVVDFILFYTGDEENQGKYQKIKANESQMKYYEQFCVFEWVGKEELTLEQISRLPICDLPYLKMNGDINDRVEASNEGEEADKRKVFTFSNYDILYRDPYLDDAVLKLSQLQKVYNDVSLIPPISTKKDRPEMLRNIAIWFALYKGF